MARKSKRPPKRTTTRAPAPRRRKASARPALRARVSDPLDAFITAAARALDLPAERAWLPAIRANLRVTLQHAASVAEFALPDDAEPAPVFKA
jgi:hypothetical protein